MPVSTLTKSGRTCPLDFGAKTLFQRGNTREYVGMAAILVLPDPGIVPQQSAKARLHAWSPQKNLGMGQL